ncbi:hypothetical protein O6P43_032064 [Quillaja saponaria]|uniref:Uncharacterized protein n=1 Tax=Quillaja saponaria TaxID=32244 RepID=A0AAD7KX53_QUISA|nr:hypothetical protein O6P43_032064 [Quillaja saponaria]
MQQARHGKEKAWLKRKKRNGGMMQLQIITEEFLSMFQPSYGKLHSFNIHRSGDFDDFWYYFWRAHLIGEISVWAYTEIYRWFFKSL